MGCFFSEIRKFSSELRIDNPKSLAEGIQPPPLAIKEGVTISCYSLTARQKVISIALCALAIISLFVGVGALNGGNFMGTKAAWIMVGSGLSVSVGIITLMSVNHLLYVKQVNKFLKTQSLNTWQNPNEYHDYDMNNPTPGTFSHSKENMTIYGKRYMESSGFSYFYIEFHKNLTIHNERS